jgi:tetratricopeptide (TPR) repeat protein
VRRSFLARLVIALTLAISFSPIRAAEQTPAVREAVAAMQRGDFPSAEKTLRAEVQAHAGDSWTLSLLGVALDNQKKIPEADEFHRRAVELSPHAAEVLNNYGTHLWTAGQYDKAETVFASVLADAPGYFQGLYNLGIMATYTGHYDRAREVLETALRQQPDNVDVLYRLACVEEASKHWEAATIRLARASKIDPRRADVQRLLALTTTELGALDDAAAAWDRYVKLAPNDDIARREQGYTAARMGKFEEANASLNWYAARHPDDPVGHYELAQAQRTVDMPHALEHLDKALTLDPNYVPARAARGSLFLQEGKAESAVADLERAAALQPNDAATLDRLGQTYQALDRTNDAIRVLRRAAELALDDSKTLLHLGRALADGGHTEESKAVMDRFRQLGPEKKQGVPAGLVDYLSLAPEQRRAEYRARVEAAVRDHPEDPAAQLAYLKLTIEDGTADQVAAAAKRIAALHLDANMLASAGHALLAANHYEFAKNLLEQAAANGGDVALDLATASFHFAATPAAAKSALAILDRLPEPARGRDYLVARSEMLDANGDLADASAALAQALRNAADRPDLYQQAVAFLVAKGRASDAVKWSGEAARVIPQNRDILLMQATTLEFAHQTADAVRLLADIQGRWPEWSAPWLASGMILDSHQRFDEARHTIETAIKLGAQSYEAFYFLADSALHSVPAARAAAESSIQQALQLSPEDPWVAALAGQIAFANGDVPLALERYRAAITLRPNLIEAHAGMAKAYTALGRKQEAADELGRARTIQPASSNRNIGTKDDSPPYLAALFQGALFTRKARSW